MRPLDNGALDRAFGLADLVEGASSRVGKLPLSFLIVRSVMREPLACAPESHPSEAGLSPAFLGPAVAIQYRGVATLPEPEATSLNLIEGQGDQALPRLGGVSDSPCASWSRCCCLFVWRGGNADRDHSSDGRGGCSTC